MFYNSVLKTQGARKPGYHQYDVKISTGNRKFAGTDATPYVVLYGDKGQTKELEVDGHLEKATTDTCSVFTPSEVGRLWKIDLWKIDPKLVSDAWYVEKIVIEYRGIYQEPEHKPLLTTISDKLFHANEPTKPPALATWEFPCHQWINNRVELWEGTSMILSQETSQSRIRYRAIELEKKRGDYQWDIALEGFPQIMRAIRSTHLPLEEKWPEEKMDDYKDVKLKAFFNMALDLFKESFHKWKHLDDYGDLFGILPVPAIAKNWREDTTFGILRLRGMNPYRLYRVTALPIPGFPVTTEMVAPFLRPGATLETEMAANRLYHMDLSMMADYESEERLKENCGLASPHCLLYVNANNDLVPIAIMLRSSVPYSEDSNPIFTPKDPEPEWLMSKILVNVTDGLVHQLWSHLMFTHFVSEPFVVSMHRNLPTCHPVFKLLHPHTRHHLTINARGREEMVTEDKGLDLFFPFKFAYMMKFAALGFREWRFDESSHPGMMKKQKITDNPQDLPGFHFRDDGKLLWDALLNFVENVMGLYYKSNSDVANDGELQNFLREIVEIGYHGEDHGFPKKAETFSTLCWTLATMMWIMSVQHATLNYVQYELFAVIPNSPASIHFYPFGHPKSTWKRGKLTMEDIFHALPTKLKSTIQIGALYALSHRSPMDTRFGNYPESYFTDSAAVDALNNFKTALETLSPQIKWDTMLPKNIPNSVAI